MHTDSDEAKSDRLMVLERSVRRMKRCGVAVGIVGLMFTVFPFVGGAEKPPEKLRVRQLDLTRADGTVGMSLWIAPNGKAALDIYGKEHGSVATFLGGDDGTYLEMEGPNSSKFTLDLDTKGLRLRAAGPENQFGAFEFSATPVKTTAQIDSHGGNAFWHVP